LPYDFYRPGEEEERLPIHLLMKNGEIHELSRESEIVDAISGKRRTDHKLYYPADFIYNDSTHKDIKAQIRALLELD
jgi:HD superfamily phosphohydrolase